MVSVFAPSEVKLLSRLCLSASVALKIPTSAMMPKEMMSEVNVVRRGEALIAVHESVMDSVNARLFMDRFLGITQI